MGCRLKKALITGVTGQDGSYLTELLLNKGYEVHGIKRRTSVFNTQRIDHLYQDPHEPDARLYLHYGDLTDTSNLTRILEQVRPDEVYNLGAQSHVGVSFEVPEYTANVDALGALRLLEGIRFLGMASDCRFYQASTSELYGLTDGGLQNELTSFHPRSPYAVAKLYAYWATINYREAYNMYACNGILFNHESERRGETFVTRKITRTLSRIFCGLDNCLFLGNINSLRDWGHARDYVEAQWLMLQRDEPVDLVIATGHQITVREFVERSAKHLGIELAWEGKGIHEIGRIRRVEEQFRVGTLSVGDVIVRIDPRYYRPSEVENLLGDSSLARDLLGWEPKVSLSELISEMTENDLRLAHQERLVLGVRDAGVQNHD